MGIPAFFRSAGAGDEAEGWNLDVLHWMLGDELEMKLWMVQRDRPEGRDVGESSQEAWDAVEMASREIMLGSECKLESGPESGFMIQGRVMGTQGRFGGRNPRLPLPSRWALQPES